MAVHDTYATRLVEAHPLAGSERVLVTDAVYYFATARELAQSAAQVVAVVDTTPRHVAGVTAQLAGVATVASGPVDDDAFWDALLAAHGPFDLVLDCGNVSQINKRVGSKLADLGVISLRRAGKGGR